MLMDNDADADAEVLFDLTKVQQLQIVLRTTITLDVLIFFSKKKKNAQSYVRSEVHLVRRNVFSAGHSALV